MPQHGEGQVLCVKITVYTPWVSTDSPGVTIRVNAGFSFSPNERIPMLLPVIFVNFLVFFRSVSGKTRVESKQSTRSSFTVYAFTYASSGGSKVRFGLNPVKIHLFLMKTLHTVIMMSIVTIILSVRCMFFELYQISFTECGSCKKKKFYLHQIRNFIVSLRQNFIFMVLENIYIALY